MKQIFDTPKKTDIAATLIKIVKTYFGIALLVIIGTIPTKGLFLLASYLWNLL